MFNWLITLFDVTIFNPLYNALVFLVGIIPGHDVGVAVITLTALVRFVLFPLSRRAVAAQLAMKQIAPEVEALKKKHADDRLKQNEAVMELYKERGVHPFAGAGLMLIQVPIMIGLYLVFARAGLPKVDPTLLYQFVHVPAAVNMEFIGLIDMAAPHSIVLAILAALSQFVYTRLSMGKTETSSPVEASLSGDVAKSFEAQARYIMPLIVGVFGYTLSAAVPLYYTTSNLFMIAQEYVSGRRF